MTYNKLMKNIEEGKMEVLAWAENYADVVCYPADMRKRPTRKVIEVTNVPKDFDK